MSLFNIIHSKDSLGITDIERELAAQKPVGAFLVGSLLDYPSPGSPANSEIQYVRMHIPEGVTLDRMGYFLDSNGSVARMLRMGLYDQSDPLDFLGVPNNRVAQTNVEDTGGAQGEFRFPVLTDAVTGGSGAPATYQVPAEGFYWVALIADNTVAKYAVSPVFRSDYLPARRESGTGTTLPATASGLTNPSSALVLVATLKQ